MDASSDRDEARAAEPEEVLEALQAVEKLKEASTTMMGRVKHMTFEDMSGVRGLYSLPPPSGVSGAEVITEPKFTLESTTDPVIDEERDTASTPTAQPLRPSNRSTRASIAKIIKDDPKLPVFTSLSAERAKPSMQKKAQKRDASNKTYKPTTPPNPPLYPSTFGTPTRPRTGLDSHTPGQLFYTSSPQSAEPRSRISPGKLTTKVRSMSQSRHSARDFHQQLSTPDISDPSDDGSIQDDRSNDDEEPHERPETGIASVNDNDEDRDTEGYGDQMDIIDYNVSSHDLDILQGGFDMSIDSHISNNQRIDIQCPPARSTSNSRATGTLISYSDILIGEAIDEITENIQPPIGTTQESLHETDQNAQHLAMTSSAQHKLLLRRPELCNAATSADRASQHIITNQQGEPEDVVIRRPPVLSTITEQSESTSARGVFIPHPNNPREPTKIHTNRCDPETCGYVLKCTMNALIEQSVGKLKKELEMRIQNMDEMLNTLDSRYNRLERRGAANEKNISDLRRTEPMAKSSKLQNLDINYAKMDGPTASNRNTTRRNIKSAKPKTGNTSESDKTLPSDGEDPTISKRARRGEDLDKTLPSDGDDPTVDNAAARTDKESHRSVTLNEGQRPTKKRQMFRSPPKTTPDRVINLDKTLPSDGEGSAVIYDAREKINASRRRRQMSKPSQSGTRLGVHKRIRSRSRSRSHSRERLVTVRRSERGELLDLRISTTLDGTSTVQGRRTVSELTMHGELEGSTHDHHHDSDHQSDTRGTRDRSTTPIVGRRLVRLVYSPERPTSRDVHQARGSARQRGDAAIASGASGTCGDDAMDEVIEENASDSIVDFDIDVNKINWNEFRW